MSYNLRLGLLIVISISCALGIFAAAAVTQNSWILGIVALSLIFVVPNIAARMLMGKDWLW